MNNTRVLVSAFIVHILCVLLWVGFARADPLSVSLQELLGEVESIDIVNMQSNAYGLDMCGKMALSVLDRTGLERGSENIFVYPPYRGRAWAFMLLRRESLPIRSRIFGVDGFSNKQWQDVERCAERSGGHFYFINEVLPIHLGFRGSVPVCVLEILPISFDVPEKFRLDIDGPINVESNVSLSTGSRYYYDLNQIIGEWKLDLPLPPVCAP